MNQATGIPVAWRKSVFFLFDILEKFPFVSIELTLDFFNIFRGGKSLWFNAAFEKDLANGAIVLGMFLRDLVLAQEVLFQDIVASELGSKVFGFDGKSREKVG